LITGPPQDFVVSPHVCTNEHKPQNAHRKTNTHHTHIHVSMSTGRGVKNKTNATQTIGWIRDVKIPLLFTKWENVQT